MKLDLRDAYFHLEIAPEDHHFLTVNTYQGMYQNPCLCFGIASALAICQKAMDHLCSDLLAQWYLDDILLMGATGEQHLENIDKVMSKLAAQGLHQKHCLIEMHEDHLGVVKTESLAQSLLWWPGLDADIERTVKACATCETEAANPSCVSLLLLHANRMWQCVHF